jgi:type IV pilus assembly protein PilE
MKQRGFNLIELMIVLSIVGVLLAYAIPSYIDHLTRTRRLTAETALMKMAGHMETYFAEHNSYEGATFDSLQLQEFVAENHYRLIIQEATTAHFKIAAQPQDIQAKNDARCGSLVLYSSGEKHIGGYGNLNECW